MKFTDGYWQLRKGVTMYRPAEAYDVEAAGDRLTIYAPARAVRHRGDTLNNALLTVELWSPMPDMIGVRLTHFAGVQDRGPRFELAHGPAGTAQAALDDEAAVLTSGRLAARAPRSGRLAAGLPGRRHDGDGGSADGGGRGGGHVCGAARGGYDHHRAARNGEGLAGERVWDRKVYDRAGRDG